MNKQMTTYLFVFIGAVFQGAGMSLFLFPHNIPSGGAAGLAILMNYFFRTPLGFGLWIVNFIFLTVALKYFGYSWTMRTMLAVTITSVTVSILTSFVALPHIHILVDLLIGSFIFGTGVGLLIRNGASSGGMVIPALMISHSYHIRPGRVMFFINISIFLLTSIVINWKIVIFAVLCQWVSTKVIDFINELELPTSTAPSFGWRKK
ncbi:MAG TPA: YitT family protein [Bacillus bacterium]|nr:YitT family protein [Bacillus sp. (in: firmicutes)]